MKTSIVPLARMNNSLQLSRTLTTWPTLVCVVMLFAFAGNATDLFWTGTTGNWNVAGNWTNALGGTQVPGAADNAFITNNGTYSVTVPAGTTATAGTLTVGGASGTQTLAIDRATVTLNGASVVNANGNISFLVSQSVLTGAGNLTVNGTLNWANGTMSGAGVTSIGSGGVLAIGSGGVTLARTLNNSGAATWAGGNLAASTGAAVNNLAGATFDITADGHLNGGATTPISNAGLFRQTAGTVSTVITATARRIDRMRRTREDGRTMEREAVGGEGAGVPVAPPNT